MKSNGKKKKSGVAAASSPKSSNNNASNRQLVDQRPETSTQLKLQTLADQRKPDVFQPKANNTGLPDALKSGIEQLSGYTMDDVRVHYNSEKPAQLNAYAYAQGTNIHLGRGQEKHLPHEAWHVVQQKQGRVQPTKQLQGKIDINDDSGLEREADQMGQAALQKKEVSKKLQKKSSDSTTIQPKMGFEFESGANKVVGADRKFVVMETAQFSLEADTKEDVEFVVNPFEKKTDILGAVGAAAAWAQTIADNKDGDNEYKFVKGGNVKNDATIKVNDVTFKASAQSTEGVRLEDLGGMIDEHIGGKKAEWSKDDADEVLKDNTLGLTEATEKKVHGLIQYMALYVRQVMDRDNSKLSSKDGPKAAFRLMARTDFNAMFQSIIPHLGMTRHQKEKGVADIKALVKEKLPGELEEDFSLNDFVFARGDYYAAGEGTEEDGRERAQGPKLGDWIDSIFTEVVKKDLMSPPAGYDAHDELEPDERYGMGAYGMDNDKVLVEMRGHRNKLKGTDKFDNAGGKVPSAKWVDFAEHFVDKAIARNPTLTDE